MSDAFEVVRMFERKMCEYTGAKYAVAVNSCTNALGICMEYTRETNTRITMPTHTYIGVAVQAKRTGYAICFDPEYTDWQKHGYYEMTYMWGPSLVDSARLLTKNMYIPGTFMCTSHHWSKHLSTEQGGCILHDCDAHGRGTCKRR
jgi:dTDP-4-amino-4,6-dideoxygalactose transaminase